MRLITKISRWRAINFQPELPIIELDKNLNAAKKTLFQIAQDDSDDYTIIDTQGFDDDDSGLVRAAVAISDLVVVPCDDSNLDIWGTHSFVQVVKEAVQPKVKRPIQMMGVLNKVHPSAKNFGMSRAALEKFGLPLAQTVIRQRGPLKDATNNGLAAVESPQAFASRDEFLALAAEIKSNIQGAT
jgi:cellulose biosynthesis protein BcsQ